MKNTFYLLGAVVGVGLLGFAYYAISPLFITVVADEALPGVTTEVTEPQPGIEPVAGNAPMVARRAMVVETAAHPAGGSAFIVEADGKHYLRYEDFKTINGPDLYVYLAKDLDAKEFVNLAHIKATEGNVNYEIPAGVDPAEYRYALVWCKQFSVLFNYADFASLL